jgi:3-(3-hydroxy-phenyl)propionate hydroxylase
VIVGAGPVGLTLALELARHGVECTVLTDRAAAPEGSRAIALHHSALTVWNRLGITGAILSAGLVWHIRRTFHGERELHRLELPEPVPGSLPLYVNLPQHHLETLLLAAAHAHPRIDIRSGHLVTSCRQHDAGVELTARTSAGCYPRFAARYAVACDGAGSLMRRVLGVSFPGRTYSDRFLIFDIRAQTGWEPQPRFYFDHPTNRGSTTLIHPQPHGIWRVDWQVGHYTPTNADDLEQRLMVLVEGRPVEVVWSSTYRFHQRLLPTLRHGRVFFAGDAAHLVAPFGARGLNSGIQDASCLAGVLRHAMTSRGPAPWLDAYDQQRMPSLIADQQITCATMRFMAPQTTTDRLRQRTILRLADHCQFARAWVDSGRMYVP